MPSSTAGATKIVVVADDTAFVRDRFKTALEQAGHRVVTVKSAAELLARVRSDPGSIDLLVLDIRLSNFSGTAWCPRFASSTMGSCRSWCSAARSAAPRKCANSPAWVWPATSTNTAPCSTFCLRIAPHLFPDNFNRRSSPRMILGIPVQYRFGNTIAAALTLNLSHGGVAIRTTSPLDAGTRLRVRFQLPGSGGDIDVEGRVAWSHRRVGMGIQFETIEAGCQAQIDNFVDAHFFSNRKA